MLSNTALIDFDDFDEVVEFTSDLSIESGKTSDLGDDLPGKDPSVGDVSVAMPVRRIAHKHHQETEISDNSYSVFGDSLKVLQNWEGIVTSVDEDSFFAAMRLTNNEDDRAEDAFEIDMDNVATGDRELVDVGAVFYLTVGLRKQKGMRPEKTSIVVFRRMPVWSRRDIQKAELAADDLWGKLQAGVSKQDTVVLEAN